MTSQADLDNIVRELREATKRAEAALASKDTTEQTETTPADVFTDFIGEQFNRSSVDVTNEFMNDPAFNRSDNSNNKEDN